MTIDDLAAYLVVPKETIYRWQVAAKGPRPYKVGRYLRWTRDEVERWLAEQAR